MSPYLHNSHSPDLHATIDDWLTRQDALGHSAYSLVDGALLGERNLRRLERAGIAWSHPLAGGPLGAYDDLGPLLIDLNGDIRQKALSLLLTATDNAPALHFLAAHPGQDKRLSQLLAWMAEIHMDDQLAFYGRLADTRVLPALLAVLSPAQHQVLGSGIAHWAWNDRQGGCTENEFPFTSRLPDTMQKDGELRPLALSDAQFAHLLQLTAVDMHYAQLLEHNPDILPALAPADTYTRFDRIIQRARARGIRDEKEEFLFLTVALTCSDDFDDAPCLAQHWETLKEGTAFSVLIQTWGDEVWDSISMA